MNHTSKTIDIFVGLTGVYNLKKINIIHAQKKERVKSVRFIVIECADLFFVTLKTLGNMKI